MKHPVQRRKRQKTVGITTTSMQMHHSYSGPLPHPSHFQQYERILPGSADRILKMVEKQSEHRQYLEKKIVDSDIRSSKTGMILGFIIAVIGLLIGGFLIYLDKNVLGLTVIISEMVLLAGAFITGTVSMNKKSDKNNKP
ncbi:MAG: DUF2335 domain-containing protein [Spirochaetota bacterium]|nr:DUF2335 domain-containing protein [Spirochaetota bacterium]